MDLKSKAKDIPEPVVMEILSRLPVKSLARFRCVSKHWASSFQSSYFITKHYRNNNVDNNPLKLIFFENPRRRGMVCDLTFFYGPCNGLLCIHDITKETLNLWNPSTREYKVIPESTLPPPPLALAGEFISFQCGFGYDSLTDDYKVVRIQTFDRISQVELYSLKTDSWKEIPAPHPCPLPRPLRMRSFNNYVNGFYYWCATCPDRRSIVLSFDVANEKFSTLPLPVTDRNLRVSGGLDLLDFNGLLGAVDFSSERFLDLWVMMNGSWTKQFSIDPFPQLWMPLGFSKIGEMFFTSSNNELALFDLATKEVKNLGISVNRYRYSLKLIAYDESLVPINGTSDEEHLIRRPAGNIQIHDQNNNDLKPTIYML